MNITINPIAFVKNSRSEPIDDNWNEIISEIILNENIPIESLNNITYFSHLEIIYYFDKANINDIIFYGHPRGNHDYPEVGIFAQRKKDRPNSLGLCRVELIKQEERTLTVKYLDAINGTPIIDIKPVFKEYLNIKPITQPDWVSDLMKKYW